MSSSVNKPTNVKQKEQDINQKLQLFGIYSAFANGKAPSNKQIDVAMNSALASKALSNPSKDLSAEGKKLVADLRDCIEKAKVLLLTKNEGELLQQFIWEAQQVSSGNASAPKAPVDKDTAQQHGKEALEGLRTLGTLLLSNGQFRKLLSDASILLRDVAGDAASKAADKVNPSDDQLAQIDKPAEDNTWHEVPKVSELKEKAKETVDKNKPFSKKDVQEAANEAANSQDKQAGGKAAADKLTAKAKQNIPQETQDKAKELKETTRQKSKAYLERKMPQDRRDQTIWRLKKMIVEIQGHDDYTQAIETLLNLAETYGSHGKDLTVQSGDAVKDVAKGNSNLLTSIKTLIERFANYTSSDDLFDSIKTLYADAQKDPELRNWFKQVDNYIRRCLQQQGYILEDASTEEGRKLYDQGRFLLRERYRDHTNRVIDEVKFMSKQFEEDPQNKAFGDSMQKLFQDLGNDENGKPVFKKHLLEDLTKIIIPATFERVRYVPVPRIEYSDKQVDAIVENLVIESDNLFPNELEVNSDNYFKWGRKKVANKNKNKIAIKVSGVQMDLRDVSYYIKKKEGFPSITDKGIMDIFMGGSGFSFKLALETADKSDREHFFKVDSVKVDIKNLKLKMKQSDHKLLFNIFKPLLLKVVKPALTKVIEKQIKDSFRKGDAFCYQVKKEADLALEEVKDNPEQAPNIYQRYWNAFQLKIAEGKEKTEEVVADKQANVAMTQHDSIFKDIKLPGGISTKATEYKELAAKGEKWESPVFSVGKAPESSVIPKASAVTRKPHAATSAALRDPADGKLTNGNGVASNGSVGVH